MKMPDFHVTFRDLLHAVSLRHGTNGFTSLPKEGVLRIFFALKNPTASTRFEPANLGTKGQHATSRPPKPRRRTIHLSKIVRLDSGHIHCHIQCVPCANASAVNGPGRGTDRSFPPSAEVNNGWGCTCAPPCLSSWLAQGQL